MKPVIVNVRATIETGVLAGVSGLVIGFDSIEDEVQIRVDDHTVITTSSELIYQERAKSDQEQLALPI